MNLVSDKDLKIAKEEFNSELSLAIKKLCRRKNGKEMAEDLIFRLRQKLKEEKKRFHLL